MFATNGKPQRMNRIIRYLMIAVLGIRKQFLFAKNARKIAKKRIYFCEVKQMERLTKRYVDDFGQKAITACGETYFEGEDGYVVVDRLEFYEDLEEQGLLVRLPCKVGDMVWDNDFGYPEPYEIKAFSYGYCDSYVEPDTEIEEIIFYYENYTGSITGSFPMSEIGKTVFLTREEAEKKLEEMKAND